MDYNEKLRLAKEALASGFYDKETIEYIFPELKERDNERIRKELISFFTERAKYTEDSTFNGLSSKEIIAWLEKQGEHSNFISKIQVGDKVTRNEAGILVNISQLNRVAKHTKRQGRQNPVDKAEPKFHEGDFITDGERIFQIKETVWERNNRNDGITYCESLIVDLRDGITYSNNTDLKEYHLWTIQDAKDGDILACESGWTCIFKSLNDATFSSYCFMDRTKSFFETGCECHTLDKEFTKAYNGEIKPATKEQRYTLMKVMKEVGYKFDFEKKELKKIKQSPTAWSREDEQNLNAALSYIKDEYLRRWFKNAIYNKYEKPVWSEEDEETLGWLCTFLKEYGHKFYKGNEENVISWLKFLKGRVQPQNGYNPYKEIVESIAETCKHYDVASHSGLRDFYDNVKVKCKDAKEYDSLFPQNTWKPSDEQMDALDYYANSLCTYCDRQDDLRSLFNDLKNLRKE